ncbi:MAG: MFS transporter [Mesorhizobium sp.]
MAGIAALALAYVLSQFYRSFLAVLTPALSAELGATKADLSLASGVWFIAFAVSQFAVGVALDRFGPRRTAGLMLALGGSGGAFLFAAAGRPADVIFAMALIGIGCAPVLMAALFIFARRYPVHRFAVLTSWLIAFGAAGNVIGAAPLANAVEAFGWRSVLVGIGALTLVVSVGLLALVRDPERPAGMAGGVGFSGFASLMRMRVLWPIIPLTAINYAPAAGIRGLWAGPYLADVYGADALVIGEVTLAMALAMILGSFLYGPLDTLFNTRKWVAVGGNLVCLAALVFLAAFTAAGLWTTAVALMVIGVSGMGYGLMMAHSRAFVPPHLIGRGVTLMNFFSIGGVGAMQFATGAVITETQAAGAPEAAYSALFGFYAATLAAALLVYLFAKDAPPRPA